MKCRNSKNRFPSLLLKDIIEKVRITYAWSLVRQFHKSFESSYRIPLIEIPLALLLSLSKFSYMFIPLIIDVIILKLNGITSRNSTYLASWFPRSIIINFIISFSVTYNCLFFHEMLLL